MSILTQTVEIVNPENPLDTSKIVVPVHKHEKIYSKEPYAAELAKRYSSDFSDDDLSVIRSYESPSFKNVCEGVVSSFNEDKGKADIVLSKKHSVTFDVDTKHASSIREDITVGETIDVVISKSKGKMIADATSKSAIIERRRQELIAQIQSPTKAYAGLVKSAVYNTSNVFNGFIVDIDGIQCFMPGSESDVVPLEDVTSIVGTSMFVMPIAVSKANSFSNGSLIVSHREFLNTMKVSTIEKLKAVDKSELVSGQISSVKSFGVFILIESCVATLLSVSEMDSETETKFKNGELKIGDTVNFYVESINNDRLTVTQTISKTEGWENLKNIVDEKKRYTLNGVVKNTFDNGIVVSAPDFNNITFFLSSKVIDLEKVTLGGKIVLDVTNVDTSKKTVRIYTE